MIPHSSKFTLWNAVVRYDVGLSGYDQKAVLKSLMQIHENDTRSSIPTVWRQTSTFWTVDIAEIIHT